MKDKSTILAIILAIAAVTVLAISFFTKEPTKEEFNKVYIVKNYSNFYTVNSCLYRVTTYISSKNSEDLLLVLSEDYKKSNNITNNNVLDVFPKIEEDSTFVSRKMYYETISKNINKYYVYGYVEKNQIFDSDEVANLDKKYMYFIVYLDTKNEIFSVEPYSGDIFLEGDINE